MLTLVRPEGLLFSRYELVYSLNQAHRLQTLAAEISFKVQNDSNIACSWVKITPDIGNAASAVFTYIPAIITSLVGLASYLKQGNNSLATSDGTRQDAIWAIILDIAGYLQYLQFIFLAGSLTMEYPGFYQPIVSRLGWSSLLYWKGPFNHGFTYSGIEDGVYVSNSSYGLEHMAQMLGYPQMPDIMLNASITLVILVAALLVIAAVVLLASLQDFRDVLDNSQVAGRLVLAVVLSCFTLPLLSYMSYEFILIGYLPSYRVTLVGLIMMFLVYLNYTVTSHFNNQRDRELRLGSMAAGESQPTRIEQLRQALLRYLPHAIPLVQGIVIGGLQDWGLAQLIVIGGCEAIVLISMVLQKRTRDLGKLAVWCASTRFVTVILSVTFTTTSNETARQWIGYLILCLHGGIIVFGYLVVSLCKVSRGLFRKRKESIYPEHSQEFPLRDISPDRRKLNPEAPLRTMHIRPGISIASYIADTNTDTDNIVAPFSPTPMGRKHYVTDFSSFYRSPRPSSARRDVSETQAASTVISQDQAVGSMNRHSGSESGSGMASASTSGSVSTSASVSAPNSIGASSNDPGPSRNILDELLQYPVNLNVDYSTREVDSYYSRTRPVRGTGNDSISSTGALPLGSRVDGSQEQNQEQGNNLLSWVRKTVASIKPAKKEKGFQVVRPPRPPAI